MCGPSHYDILSLQTVYSPSVLHNINESWTIIDNYYKLCIIICIKINGDVHMKIQMKYEQTKHYNQTKDPVHFFGTFSNIASELLLTIL